MPTMPKMSMPTGASVKSLIRDPYPFVAAWVTGAFLAVFIPIIHWNKKKEEYYNYLGYQIEYENAQRAYEEANNDNNDNNNNYYYTSNCSWWQYQCKKKAYAAQQYYQNQQGDEGDDVQVPNWYLFLGGQTEEMRRQAEENGQDITSAPGALKFVYWWTLLIFGLLVLYGAAVLLKRKDGRVVVFGLVLFCQFALCQILLMPQGVISSDNRDLEDSIYGWHGQMGVLLVYTAFWMMLYCCLFTLALTIRMLLEYRQKKKEEAANKDDATDVEASANYKEYEEPKVTIS